MLRIKEKKHKLLEDDISINDLPEYLQSKAIPNTKVHILKIGKWKLIGDTWILVKSTGADMDDAWATIVVRKNKPFWDWILLAIAKSQDKGKIVVNWHNIDNTNIILDFWYLGDGTPGTPIVFQSK